jgi:hypothetical protein
VADHMTASVLASHPHCECVLSTAPPLPVCANHSLAAVTYTRISCCPARGLLPRGPLVLEGCGRVRLGLGVLEQPRCKLVDRFAHFWTQLLAIEFGLGAASVCERERRLQNDAQARCALVVRGGPWLEYGSGV